MLVDHTDPKRSCVVWVSNRNRGSVFTDLPFFRLVHAKQDRHERRFTRAVFPEDAVHLAGKQVKVDAPVGVPPLEDLIYAAH